MALAIVDCKAFGEIAELAVGAGKITKRRPACRNRLFENIADCCDEPLQSLERERTAGSLWTDARAKKGFADVDVAKACDDALVAEEQLDRSDPSAKALAEIAGVEVERLRSKRLECRPIAQITRGNQVYRAKAARVIESKPPPLVSFQQQVIVLFQRRVIDAPGPRHAEVKNHRVIAVGMNQAIFGAPTEAGDLCTSQALSKVFRKRAPKIGPARLNARDPPAFEHPLEAADSGLDFGKFGHFGHMAKRAQAR